VWDAYAADAALMAALTTSGARKAPLTLPPTEIFARYRPDLSQGPAWAPGQGRFLIIAVTNTAGHSPLEGTVFETDDGTRVTIVPAHTRDEADAIATAAGPAVTVFAVRPGWSFPAQQWVDADPSFWVPAG
jgi:hypothetical protein